MAWDSLSNTWAEQSDGWDTLYLNKSASLGGALQKVDRLRSVALVGALTARRLLTPSVTATLLETFAETLSIRGLLQAELGLASSVSALLEGPGTKFVALQGLLLQERLESLGLVGALQELYLKEPSVRGLIQKLYTPSLGIAASVHNSSVKVMSYDTLGVGTDVTGVALRFHDTDTHELSLLNPVKRGEFSFEKLFGFVGGEGITNLNTYTDGADLWSGGLRIWAEVLSTFRVPEKPVAVGAKVDLLTYTGGSPLNLTADEYLCMAVEVDVASVLGPQVGFPWYVSYDEVGV